MINVVSYRPAFASDLLAVWHAAFGDRYPMIPALWDAITVGDHSFRDADAKVAMRDGRVVGFALAKRFREEYPGCECFKPVGYLALMAVHPDHQRRGIGSELLRIVEERFRADGAVKVVLGGSFHHVFPGIPLIPGQPPASEPAVAFFEARGYVLGKEVWDVRRDLAVPPELPELSPLPAGLVLRPTRPDEASRMLDFLNREFAGRWPRDVAYHLSQGGSAAHVFGLFVEGEPQGFALLHPPGSPGALRWAGFIAGISALGPIGVGSSLRGKGLGLTLLVRALEQLRDWGATETVIDWTDLLDFYARCGFAPWLRYVLVSKEL